MFATGFSLVFGVCLSDPSRVLGPKEKGPF